METKMAKGPEDSQAGSVELFGFSYYLEAVSEPAEPCSVSLSKTLSVHIYCHVFTRKNRGGGIIPAGREKDLSTQTESNVAGYVCVSST